MTPVTLDNAVCPLGALKVMYSAHGENATPLISSLMLKPVGRTWKACSLADCVLKPSDPESAAGLTLHTVNSYHD